MKNPSMRIVQLSKYITLLLLAGCAFNFEITSGRTALEKQIIGSYQEIDESYTLLASVRAVDESGKVKKTKVSPERLLAVDAKQSQAFNHDDIEELKDQLVLGEGIDGLIKVVPAPQGRIDAVKPEVAALAKQLVAEENRDRAVIWIRVIEQSPELSEKNKQDVIKVFANTQREKEKLGRWIETSKGVWEKKEKK